MPSAEVRAAASSIASGMPSRWRQIAAIDGRFSACGEKSEFSAFALAMKSSAAL